MDYVSDATSSLTSAAGLGWDGALHPILLEGTPVGADRISAIGGTFVGAGIGMNRGGQVAVTASLRDPNGIGGEAVLLLTPTSP